MAKTTKQIPLDTLISQLRLLNIEGKLTASKKLAEMIGEEELETKKSIEESQAKLDLIHNGGQ